MIALAASSSSSTSIFDQPGTLGFLVVFGMGVILYFVFRSLARQLRKVNEAARAEAASQQEAEAAASEHRSPAAPRSSPNGSPPTQ